MLLAPKVLESVDPVPNCVRVSVVIVIMAVELPLVMIAMVAPTGNARSVLAGMIMVCGLS